MGIFDPAAREARALRRRSAPRRRSTMDRVELSAVIPVIGARGATAPTEGLLDELRVRLAELGVASETIVVRGRRYGDALAEGLERARGEHVLTLDHDF